MEPGLHAAHGRQVAAMFSRIARWYDLLNRTLSAGQDIYWRHRLAATALAGCPGESPLVLDLAAGTLDVSLTLLKRRPGARVLALDFALPMLAEGARRKLGRGRGRSILPVQADGRSLPLPDACLDAATIAFGIRNILPRAVAYAELLRCLKPGGRLCILEFGTGSRRIWRGVYNFYLDRVLPGVGRLVSGDAGAYRYLADTIRAFPDERALGRELLQAGFGRVFFYPLLSGIVYVHAAEKPRSFGKEGAAQGDHQDAQDDGRQAQ